MGRIFLNFTKAHYMGRLDAVVGTGADSGNWNPEKIWKIPDLNLVIWEKGRHIGRNRAFSYMGTKIYRDR